MRKMANLVILFLIGLLVLPASCLHAQNKATLKISFLNTIQNTPVMLDSVQYSNCWNEDYTISKLKYYISNIELQTADKKVIKEDNSYHLINEEDTASKSFSFLLSPEKYTSISFVIGVDSLKNVSGAQTGALDPMNGMFWTWNTGYIMLKLEGSSPQSNAINNKVEYHIGGFSGNNNVLRKVKLIFKNNAVLLKKGTVTTISIRTNIDKIWNAAHPLKIAQIAACMTPGPLAASIADNYSKAFDIINIIQQ